MSAPLVSVILPVWNAERYLGEALASVFAQAHRPLEVIAIDDGSTDVSAAILSSYGAAVTVLRQQNAGPAAARNAGLAVARGEFIAFQDADDRWHPRKLERHLAHFEAHPWMDLSVCLVQNVWDGDPADEDARLAERQLPRLFRGVVMQAVMARRRVFDRIGIFDPSRRFCEDTDWYLRAAEAQAGGAWLEEVLVFRRVHDRNMTREFPAVRVDTLAHVFKASIDRIRHRRRADASGARPPLADRVAL